LEASHCSKETTISTQLGDQNLVQIGKNDGWKEIKLQGLYPGKSDLEIEMLDQLEDESAFSRHFT